MEYVNTPSEARSVLILKADRLYADTLRQMTLSVLPHASIRIAASVAEGAAALASAPVDLLLTGIGPSLAGDVLELVSTHSRSGNRPVRTLVITTSREPHPLEILRRLPIHGVFDSLNESPEQLRGALALIADGGCYWSQTFLIFLRKWFIESRSLSRTLTPLEQLVLSIVGDGCDDLVASRKLRLSPSTITTVRRSLHRKLGVQHRGELIRIAVQIGFVQFTSTGVIRPGFALLAAAYHPRRRKKAEYFAA